MTPGGAGGRGARRRRAEAGAEAEAEIRGLRLRLRLPGPGEGEHLPEGDGNWQAACAWPPLGPARPFARPGSSRWRYGWLGWLAGDKGRRRRRRQRRLRRALLPSVRAAAFRWHAACFAGSCGCCCSVRSWGFRAPPPCGTSCSCSQSPRAPPLLHPARRTGRGSSRGLRAHPRSGPFDGLRPK